MSIQFLASAPTPIAIKLTTTNPTVVAGDPTRAVTVDWFQATEILGNSPNLSIDLFDATYNIGGYRRRCLRRMTKSFAVEYH